MGFTIDVSQRQILMSIRFFKKFAFRFLAKQFIFVLVSFSTCDLYISISFTEFLNWKLVKQVLDINNDDCVFLYILWADAKQLHKNPSLWPPTHKPQPLITHTKTTATNHPHKNHSHWPPPQNSQPLTTHKQPQLLTTHTKATAIGHPHKNHSHRPPTQNQQLKYQKRVRKGIFIQREATTTPGYSLQIVRVIIEFSPVLKNF